MAFNQPSLLWVLYRGGREIACWVRRLPRGAEMSVRMDGREYFVRVFPSGAALQAEATAKRGELEADGWTARDTD